MFKKSLILFVLALFLLTLPIYSEEKEEEKNIKYFSSTSFSTLLTSGNTEDFSLSIETDQNLHFTDHRFNLKGNIIYSLSNGEKKSEIYGSSLNYNWKVNSRFYILGLTKFTRNVFSGYNFRFAFSGGIGYSFINKEKIQFSSDVAFGWSTENNTEITNQEILNSGSSSIPKSNVTESFFSTIISTKFKWALSPTTSLENDGMIFLNLEDLEGYRLTSHSSISVSINQNFALKTSFQINYENKPVPGYKTTDLFILSSLMFKI